MAKHIYLLSMGDGIYKIGLSGNPDRRHAEISAEWQEKRQRKVAIVKVQQVWNMQDAEQRLHEQFRRYQIKRDHRMLRGIKCNGDTELFGFNFWQVWQVKVAMSRMGRFAFLDLLMPIGLIAATAVAFSQPSAGVAAKLLLDLVGGDVLPENIEKRKTL